MRKGSFLRANPANFDDLEWDDHLGGDEVAVRVKDLDLAESRFDGHVEATSGLGYGEWTMVFRNGAPGAARGALPGAAAARRADLTADLVGER